MNKVNKIVVNNYKAEVGFKMEQFLDLISDVKIDTRSTKNEHIESMKVNSIRDVRLAIGVKTPMKEILTAQENQIQEKLVTSEKIDEINKKIMFLLNGFEEELSELLEELSEEI